jgi:hypothetical protein
VGLPVGAQQRARLPRGEFTALWSAEALSVLGDQLAKVAMALLVFERTGSAVWSGLAYGLTFLTPLITGPALSGLADRNPRRTVMVACCLAQGGCVALMALPALPLAAVVAGAMLVAGIQVPFKAAQGAVVLDILGGEFNKAGRARLTMIRETGQLIGLAGGAAAVALIGVRGAFLLDTATFVAAAVLLRSGLIDRPAATRSSPQRGSAAGAVWRAVATENGLRRLVVLIGAIGITAVPDAVVVPFVAETGAPVWMVGPLLAADCLGLVIAAAVVEGLPADRQRRLIGPLAVLSVAPLVLFAFQPGVVVALALLIISGAGAAYLPLAIGEVTERVHPGLTGTTNGLINVLLRASQGLAAITAGVLAQPSSAAMAVAVFGALGVVLTGTCALSWHRARVADSV